MSIRYKFFLIFYGVHEVTWIYFITSKCMEKFENGTSIFKNIQASWRPDFLRCVFLSSTWAECVVSPARRNMKTFGYLIKYWMEISLLCCGRNKFFTRNQSVVAVVEISYQGMKHWIGVDIFALFFPWIKMQILSVIDPSKDGKITKLRGTVVFKLRNFQFIICL